ncbi:SHOCT domain-containing protein [bacterium]|nr:SHOCT domain-containing protein [bacterium]
MEEEAAMHGVVFGVLPMMLMWLFWAVIFVAVVLLIVKLATGSWGSTDAKREHKDTAEEILKQRYARGEISKDDYDRILADLRK